MITIREAWLADAALIAPLLREGDAAECAALGDTVQIIERSIIASGAAWCALDDNEPLALWGWRAHGDGLEVWCLTARGVARHRKRMLAENRAFVASLPDQLFAFVLADYRLARRWLAWLGFRETITVMIGDQQFIKVVR